MCVTFLRLQSENGSNDSGCRPDAYAKDDLAVAAKVAGIEQSLLPFRPRGPELLLQRLVAGKQQGAASGCGPLTPGSRPRDVGRDEFDAVFALVVSAGR